jgi:arylsulfatase A-like enzyme
MPSSSRKPKPRAIIVVTLDALRADHVGCYGYPLSTTPFIDELAKETIKFEYAFSPIGLTAPASASMLTGKYPRFHSVEFLNGLKPLNREQEVTLPLLLSGLGYSTAAFVSIMPLQRHAGLQHGFDYYDDNLTEAELNRPQELLSIPHQRLSTGLPRMSQIQFSFGSITANHMVHTHPLLHITACLLEIAIMDRRNCLT